MQQLPGQGPQASPTPICATSTRCRKNTGEVLKRYKKVLVPELNGGQLRMLLRATFLVDAVGLNKVQGKPFLVSEIEQKIEEMLDRRFRVSRSASGTAMN